MEFTTIGQELAVTRQKKSIQRETEMYFEAMGFSLIEPRIFQNYDEYARSNFRQEPSHTVKVLGGDARILILRPEITTNVLGEIFSKWNGESPLKVYYNSTIYQTQPGGKIQERDQMGVESLAENRMKADQEIVGMALQLMCSLDVPYVLELGSSRFLEGWFREKALPKAQESELRELIRSKNRSSLTRCLAEMELFDTILDSILDLQGDITQVVAKAKAEQLNEEMRIALSELEGLMAFLSAFHLAQTVQFDLSLLPDLDYYDGIIFKGFCLGTPKKILSGGRYDRLTEAFGPKVPAIGFMIDLDLLTRIRLKEDR